MSNGTCCSASQRICSRASDLHPVHGDLLDDHVAAADGGHDLLGLDSSRAQQTLDRIGHDARIHDLAFHDGIIHHRGIGHLGEDRFARTVIDGDELDQPAADVEGHRGPFPTEERHRCLTRRCGEWSRLRYHPPGYLSS
jgi:hypothetical protein